VLVFVRSSSSPCVPLRQLRDGSYRGKRGDAEEQLRQERAALETARTQLEQERKARSDAEGQLQAARTALGAAEARVEQERKARLEAEAALQQERSALEAARVQLQEKAAAVEASRAALQTTEEAVSQLIQNLVESGVTILGLQALADERGTQLEGQRELVEGKPLFAIRDSLPFRSGGNNFLFCALMF